MICVVDWFHLNFRVVTKSEIHSSNKHHRSIEDCIEIAKLLLRISKSALQNFEQTFSFQNEYPFKIQSITSIGALI